ncbi:MAG: GTPase ObgE [Bradymonadales bacterium]|nr:MAG: GTPase ObgE [Bradymonadales bacterium]
MSFIDECRIRVKAGNGGNGAVSFHRGPHLPKGGPDGGNGGRGASIYFEGNPNLQSLLDFKYQREFIAKRGQDGRGKDCDGRSAEDLVIPVPLGTRLHDEKSKETWDITEAGQKLLMASGGKGGRGNRSFRSSTQQAPRIATPGQIGQERELRLELLSLCDIGFVGLPNAGKSSLLKALTAARPKVADYPFTTLQPQLGVMELEGHSVQMADIPGLVKEAHQNQGLGHRFLRHIARARNLLVVLGLDSERSLESSLDILLSELRLYDPKLLEKERLLVVNKSDLLTHSEDLRKDWENFQKLHPESLLISALHQEGLSELKRRLSEKGSVAKDPSPPAFRSSFGR